MSWAIVGTTVAFKINKPLKQAHIYLGMIKHHPPTSIPVYAISKAGHTSPAAASDWIYSRSRLLNLISSLWQWSDIIMGSHVLAWCVFLTWHSRCTLSALRMSYTPQCTHIHTPNSLLKQSTAQQSVPPSSVCGCVFHFWRKVIYGGNHRTPSPSPPCIPPSPISASHFSSCIFH